MTPTDPQAERLRDALHQRVDTMHDAPISLEAVRGRAGRIQRRRRVAAGAGVAAVVAVVAPVGVVAQGQLVADEAPVTPTERVTEVPAPPAAGEDTAFTTSALPEGPATDRPWIDVRREAVVLGDRVVDSPVAMPQDAVRYGGGLLVTGIEGGRAQLWIVPDDGEPAGTVDVPEAPVLTAAPTRDEVAYVESVGSRGQQLVLTTSTEVLGDGDTVEWDLPEVGGFTPVGIGPDGVVLNALYPDGRTEVLLADRATLDVEPVEGLVKATGVAERTGEVTGVVEGERPCSAVVVPETDRTAIPSCELAYRSISPDGRWVTATTIEVDGLGDPSLLVLDSRTGALQAGWSSRSNPPVTWVSSTWEDGDTVVANVVEGTRQAIVRFELDGTAALASEPVEVDPFADLAVVLPD